MCRHCILVKKKLAYVKANKPSVLARGEDSGYPTNDDWEFICRGFRGMTAPDCIPDLSKTDNFRVVCESLKICKKKKKRSSSSEESSPVRVYFTKLPNCSNLLLLRNCQARKPRQAHCYLTSPDFTCISVALPPFPLLRRIQSRHYLAPSYHISLGSSVTDSVLVLP